jgi:hypothetical protein
MTTICNATSSMTGGGACSLRLNHEGHHANDRGESWPTYKCHKDPCAKCLSMRAERERMRMERSGENQVIAAVALQALCATDPGNAQAMSVHALAYASACGWQPARGAELSTYEMFVDLKKEDGSPW